MNIFKEIIKLIIEFFSRKIPASTHIPTSQSPVVSPPPFPAPITPLSLPIETTVSESVSLQILENSIIIETVGIITAEQLKRIVTTLSEAKCKELLPHLLQTMTEFGVNTPIRVAAFIAQTAHESAGYSAFLENLNYSAQALLNTWPNRFTPESATIYARQPEKIANHVYINRLGNGDEASGDGWRYRGRGVIQTTGRINYMACGSGLGLDLITSPELLEQPLNAFRSAGWYWKSHNCSSFADSDNFTGLTKAINGGLNGLDDRKAYYARAKSVLGIA